MGRMRSWHIALRAGVVGLVMVGLTATPAAAQEFTPGSPGLGDPYFPLAGNGGYDVGHYALDFSYDPSTRQLDGTATISATATQDLSRFDLDLRGFDIQSLSVNGAPATFTRDGQELVITPAAGLVAGTAFTVVVGYQGVPSVVTDPDGSIEGWVPTDDGAFVVGEPQGSPAWYPANDNPRDKATYDFTITVPAGLTVMANGVLDSRTTVGDQTTFVWRAISPMAPYLATATLGRFDLTETTLAGGLPSYVAVDPTLAKGNVLRKLPDIVEFYSSIYGPYPFEAVGAIVDDAKEVGYSLETDQAGLQPGSGRGDARARDLPHVVRRLGNAHRMARHLATRGFATWSEWIWSEYNGQKSAHHWFKTHYNTPAQDTAFWTPPPGDPGGPEFMFNGTIYNRGAMTLQALREKIGDTDFFELLAEWASQNRYGNVTTPEFIALAEKVSGQELNEFFDIWLYRPEKPTSW
jgi:aminopeptidase N